MKENMLVAKKMVTFANVAPLKLAETLDCGQAFRWIANSDGVFTGVVCGASVTVSLADGVLSISGENIPDEKYWRDYFALDVDYAGLQSEYATDSVLAACVAYAPGIRVLRQDFFETLISFIISQNNNIPRIKGIIERLCENFGDKIQGSSSYSFPSAEKMAALSVDDLAVLRAGYRVTGLLDAARRVSEGRLSEIALRAMSTPEARKALLEVYGVGPKVADCVLLFGLGRFETFPVDVWIRRAMARLFPAGLPLCALRTAGIAQQYIFNYARATITN